MVLYAISVWVWKISQKIRYTVYVPLLFSNYICAAAKSSLPVVVFTSYLLYSFWSLVILEVSLAKHGCYSFFFYEKLVLFQSQWNIFLQAEMWVCSFVFKKQHFTETIVCHVLVSCFVELCRLDCSVVMQRELLATMDPSEGICFVFPQLIRSPELRQVVRWSRVQHL